MTISDEARYRLHQRLDETLGPEQAATLMAHLPPVGWADVATKQDVENLGVSLRSDMATLRSEMTSEFADVRTEFRTEFANVRTEFRTEFANVRTELADVRTELRSGFAGVQSEFASVRSEFNRELRLMTWRMVMVMVAVMSVFVAAIRL